MQAFLRIVIAVFFSPAFFNSPVQAELMGMVPGRSARVESHANASIELGASWYTKQLQWSTVRINVKPSPNLTLYVDYAKLRVNKLPVNASLQSGFAGNGAGGGILFGIPDFFLSYDVAFKGAYHATVIGNTSDTERHSRMDLSLYQRQLSAEFVFSPIDPLFDNGFAWYGTIGFVSTDAQTQFINMPLTNPIRYREKNGWALGAGVVRPFKYGSVYAGVTSLAGDPLLAGGVRYLF